MSGVLETTPPRTQAAILRAVLAQKYPKLALPTIASNFSMQMVDLRVIIEHHGYPRVAAMEAAAIELEHVPAATMPAFSSKPTATAAADVDQLQHAGEVEAAAVADDETAETILVRVPVAQLHPDPDNLRENLEDIEDLADSIREAGLLQPIVARRDGRRLVIVAGHRRLAAIKLLRWTDVPVIINATIKPADVLAAMLIENGQRKDLDPIEEARGLATIKARDNLSDHELAKKVGRSQPAVSARIALLSLSAEDQLQVRAGTMTLVEGTHRGRLNSGKVAKKGQDKNWHLSPTHELADRAKARCIRLEHSRGRTVGGMACGACWESVIRADEREHITTISHQLGKCVTCDHPIGVKA